MFGYDARFASILAADRSEALRKSYTAGRVPYRSADASRDGDPAPRPVLAAPLGSTCERRHTTLSRRAA